MSAYIHFTDEQKYRAANVDLVDFLRRQGEQLIRSGREWRWKRHDSVCVNGNRWYRHSTETGGGPIGFVQEFFDKSYTEAITMLLNGEQGEIRQAAPKKSESVRKPFALPEANPTMSRVFAYLIKQRFIDNDIIAHFAHEKKLYEDKEFHNAVFVGYDENGVARHAHKKGTYTNGDSYRGNVESSDPRYSFNHIGQSNRIYVFESAIDMLSFITLHKENWQQHSYIALDGVSPQALIHQLSVNSHLRQVVLCLDNDAAGIEARYKIAEELLCNDYAPDNMFSHNKGWNEDLKAQNGITPIPASKHERMELYRFKIGCLSEKYLNNDKELRSQIWSCFKMARDSCDSEVQKQNLLKLSELSLSAASKMMVQMENKFSREQYHFYLRTKLYGDYLPHHDRGKLKSKMQVLNGAVNAVMSDLNKIKVKSKAEMQDSIDGFLFLADTSLRAWTEVELQDRKMMHEQKEEQNAVISM